MTATPREQVAALIFYGFVALLVFLVYRIFRPFLVPLAWAAVLAMVCYPWHARLARRWGATRAAVLSTMLVAFIVIGPLFFIGSSFVTQGLRVVEAMRQAPVSDAIVPDWLEQLWDAVADRLPGLEQLDPGPVVADVAQRAAVFLASQAPAMVQNIAVFVFDLVVALFATFFLFRDAPGIVRAIRNALPFEETVRERMIARTQTLVRASVSSGLIVATIQGLLGGLAFAILGLPAPVFWGVVMGFLCILPLGAWIVWLPAALWLLATGSVARGLILIGVGAGIVSAVDNVVRPALLSGRTQMNGLLMFISMVGGVIAFGLIGIVLGPILVATAAGLFDAYTTPAPVSTAADATTTADRKA